MPGKGGSRKGKIRYRGGKRDNGMSDEDSVNDSSSQISDFPDDNALDEVNDDELSQCSDIDAFENDIKYIIDGLTEKNSKGRIKHFQTMEKMLATKYYPDFIEEMKMTITDSIERGLKKGCDTEKIIAARLSSQLCVQLGIFESAEVVSKDLTPILTFIANDSAASSNVRSECCWALSINQFICGCDDYEIAIYKLLTTIFSGSYLNGNGAVATITASEAALHAAAISGWTLLLTLMAPSDVCKILGSKESKNFMPSLNQLCELLQSPHLDVRISAGEALAVIFELGRDFSDDYEQEWSLDLIEVLQTLATESNKSTAKKDRKQQRASFREILQYIEEDIMPKMKIKLDHEVFNLVGWCTRIQYNACCRFLGPGINIHLSKNDLLREIFNLGKQLPSLQPMNRIPKLHKTLMNAAAFKGRTIVRNKDREIRAAFKMM